MANLQTLLKKADNLDQVYKAQSNAFDFGDRALLDFSGDIFEIVFSHLFSFQWLTFFLSELPGTTYQQRLPYLNQGFSIHRPQSNAYKNNLRYGTYCVYSNSFIDYCFNVYEMPFVFLHWATSHIGKVFGWVLAAPFAAVGYALKKIYYGIQENFYQRQLEREFSKCDDLVKLAADWIIEYKNPYLKDRYITRLLGRLEPQQVLDGIFSSANFDTTLAIRPLFSNRDQNYMDYLCQPHFVIGENKSLVEYEWNKYAVEHFKYLESQRKWALAKTILSGLLLFPLFYTIPSYKKLVFANESKLAKLHAITDEFKEKKDPRLFAGERLLINGINDAGLKILASIPEHNKYYEKANSMMGYHQLATGSANDATHSFAKSNEKQAQQIAQTLAIKPNASLNDVTTDNKVFGKNNSDLRTHGIFSAETSISSNEITSLDDEENENNLSATLLSAAITRSY